MPDWFPEFLQCTYEEALEQWASYENDMEQMKDVLVWNWLARRADSSRNCSKGELK